MCAVGTKDHMGRGRKGVRCLAQQLSSSRECAGTEHLEAEWAHGLDALAQSPGSAYG